MKTALSILADEHQSILQMIEALLDECGSLDNGGKINKDFFTKAIIFAEGYADGFHHSKEEDILFVELVRGDVQMHCDSTEQMLHEHMMSREFIKLLEKGVKENDKEKIIENGREYAQLLQDHIYKEDNILYPMADEVLSREDKEDMLEKFIEIEQDLTKEIEDHLAFLESLNNKLK